MPPRLPPSISAAVFNQTATPATRETLSRLLSSSQWSLSTDGTGIQRRYEFGGFKKAMMFWNRVADECKNKGHHPEWANVYNKVEIRWTTHEPRGLGEIDVQMAEFCDQAADEIGLKKKKPVTEAEPKEAKPSSGGLLDEMLPSGSECDVCVGTKGK